MPVTLPSLPDLIRAHGLLAKKSLGQHFLLDAGITGRIARYADIQAGTQVIEIGPGPGGLTRALLASPAACVTAIEMDERAIHLLAHLKEAYGERFRLIEGDALKISLPETVPAPRQIVANLPYNAGTLMLLNWLDDIYHDPKVYTRLTLMFQKEVAGRIVAKPGSKAYGRLSVIAQWLCDVEEHMELPPGAFSPPPKVHSTVLSLIPLSAPRFPAEKAKLEKVVAAAFNQRRKMLRSALKSLFGAETEAKLVQCGIDPAARAEEIGVEAFCRLASA